MAAGRGQFFYNFVNGLVKTANQQPQAQAQAQGRGKSSRGKMKHKTGGLHGHRLPSEILLKIVSYLDATSLYFLSHVNRKFHHLANDDLLWHKIYMSQFGVTQLWCIDHTIPKVAQAQSSSGLWKQKYFKALAGQELDKWMHELRDINPYTGLPRQTEWVLRNLNVCWQLRAQDSFGQEVTLKPSKVYFFETSVVLRWSSDTLPYFHQITNLELLGLREEMKITKKPLWHSLMLRLDLTDGPRTIGKDRLIKLLFLSPGFIVGIWRGRNVIAFIMVCLHFHRLLERSLFGSPVSQGYVDSRGYVSTYRGVLRSTSDLKISPYLEPRATLPLDKSDSKFGLRGYSLHFVLHNTGAELMSEHFPDLSCHQISRHLMALGVIYKSTLSCHCSLSGTIKLPWKTEELEGSIKNCCFMTLTLLDEFQKPFWCVSAPITITRSKRSLSFDYNGEHFLMGYHHPEGQVRMKLVWLQEQNQFFLIDLIIYIPTNKVNEHFCTKY